MGMEGINMSPQESDNEKLKSAAEIAMEKFNQEEIKNEPDEKIMEDIASRKQVDTEKAAEILKKLKGEETGGEKTEHVMVENSDQTKETNQENLIEKIGAPKNEMFGKYGDRMRQAADELVLNREKMIANEKELKKVEHGSEEWKKLWNENRTLNDKRNELSNDATWGSNVIKNPGQQYGESYTQYSEKRTNLLEKYREAAMDDPYVVLRMIEAGELGGDANGSGLGKVSERLMENPGFVRQSIKLAGKHENGSYGGWFWRNVTGEARTNKDLFREAVKLNHLNYQFGLNEWKSDPVIQKTALESGLDPSYLHKE
jgi:hypothetical protein